MKQRYLEVTYRKRKPLAAYLYLPRPLRPRQRNYARRVVVQLTEARESKKRRSLSELLAQRRARQEARAAERRRALASGELRSRAALARREGVSRAWVTKVVGKRLN